MLMNIVIGLSMMAVCLLLQGMLVVQALRFYVNRQERMHSALLSGMRVTVGLMCILIVGNVAQVFAWAMLFLWLGEFQQLSAAVYHSAVNFATLGYGDLVMSDDNKLLGPLEALNGAMMIGVSTAALTRAFAVVMNDHVLPPAD